MAVEVGDLVRNRVTGCLYIVTGVGGDELKMWITLYGTNDIVYHAVYFYDTNKEEVWNQKVLELVSSKPERD